MAYSPAENLYLSALTELQFPSTLQQDEVQAAADAGEAAMMEPIKLAQAPTKTMSDAGQGIAEMRPIDPTIRQRLADFLQAGFEGVGVDRAKARKQAQTIIGGPSSNLPLDLGLADLVPFLGTAMQTQEAARMGEEAVQSVQRGEPAMAAMQGAGAAVGLLPGGAATAKAIKAGARAAKKGTK